MTEAYNVRDFERLAEEKLEPGVWGYFAGGAMDEVTLRDNVAAYRRWRLRPRVLCDVAEVSTATTVLGTEVSMPLCVAPVAYQRMLDPGGECATARATEAAGTIMCLSTIATASPAEVAAAAPGLLRWFQLYVFKDWGVTCAIVDQAVESGFSAIALTADTPLLGRRERDFYTTFVLPDDLRVPSITEAAGHSVAGPLSQHFQLISPSVSWKDVERLSSHSKLPVLVKGVLTREDAQLACESGAAGVIVSNHGGRQLDGVAATLDALPEVAEAVDGRIEVLIDGGIRRGTDVLKALALGARAAFAGRAVAYALAAGGEDGVRRVLSLLQEEIRLGLGLLGCTSPDGVGRSHVERARDSFYDSAA